MLATSAVWNVPLFQMRLQAFSYPVLKRQSGTLPKAIWSHAGGTPVKQFINFTTLNIHVQPDNSANQPAHTQRLSGSFGFLKSSKLSKNNLQSWGTHNHTTSNHPLFQSPTSDKPTLTTPRLSFGTKRGSHQHNASAPSPLRPTTNYRPIRPAYQAKL